MMNVAVARPPSDRRAVRWLLAGLSALIGLGLALVIAVPAVTRPDWAIAPGVGTQWWQAGPDDDRFLVGMLIAFGLAMRFFAGARGRRRFMEREWTARAWLAMQSAHDLAAEHAAGLPTVRRLDPVA